MIYKSIRKVYNHLKIYD